VGRVIKATIRCVIPVARLKCSFSSAATGPPNSQTLGPGKFVVLPKRWIVERTIGWLKRCRRLAKDWECRNQTGRAFLRWASVRLMMRKLCQTKI
jgi:transposase